MLNVERMVTVDNLYKKEDPTALSNTFLVGSVLLIISVLCAVPLCVFTFWVPCCDDRFDFRFFAFLMFGSSLDQVVSGKVHVRFVFRSSC